LLLPQELEHWCPFLGSTPVSPVSCLPFLWRWLARPRRRARLYLTGPSHVEEVPSKNKKKLTYRGGEEQHARPSHPTAVSASLAPLFVSLARDSSCRPPRRCAPSASMTGGPLLRLGPLAGTGWRGSGRVVGPPRSPGRPSPRRPPWPSRRPLGEQVG
jgi:hypothetical protein